MRRTEKYMCKIPKDPIMLLSFVNLKLRDECSTLDVFCENYNITQEILTKSLSSIDYYYVKSENQFK